MTSLFALATGYSRHVSGVGCFSIWVSLLEGGLVFLHPNCYLFCWT